MTESAVKLKSLVGKFLIYEKVKSAELEDKLFGIATDSCDIDMVFFIPMKEINVCFNIFGNIKV